MYKRNCIHWSGERALHSPGSGQTLCAPVPIACSIPSSAWMGPHKSCDTDKWVIVALSSALLEQETAFSKVVGFCFWWFSFWSLHDRLFCCLCFFLIPWLKARFAMQCFPCAVVKGMRGWFKGHPSSSVCHPKARF